MGIEIRTLTPTIGAEISGVDLAGELTNREFDAVHQALLDHCVIFFRDQDLTIDQHKAFGARFGKLHVHPNAGKRYPEHPEILTIEAGPASKRVAGEVWHPNQRSTTEPDGSYVLEVPYSDERELLGDLLRFGADVEVLAPQDLRSRIKKALHGAVGRYV